MKFQLLDIIPYRADPLAGLQVSAAERLERFAADVAPVLRRELPTTLWTEEDAGTRVADAVAA